MDRKFGLLDKMTFGKCKGAEVRIVIEDDPDYIDWCLDNIPWFKLSTAAQELLDKQERKVYTKSSQTYSSFGERDCIDQDDAWWMGFDPPY